MQVSREGLSCGDVGPMIKSTELPVSGVLSLTEAFHFQEVPFIIVHVNVFATSV